MISLSELVSQAKASSLQKIEAEALSVIPSGIDAMQASGTVSPAVAKLLRTVYQGFADAQAGKSTAADLAEVIEDIAAMAVDLEANPPAFAGTVASEGTISGE